MTGVNLRQLRFAEHCNGSCTANYSGGYGDGVIQSAFGEVGDDGNDATNDSCPSGPSGPCQNARCGDGLVWDVDGGIETCEPGVSNVLSCQELDGAELDGLVQCSAEFVSTIHRSAMRVRLVLY